jgi:hypothetical protein
MKKQHVPMEKKTTGRLKVKPHLDAPLPSMRFASSAPHAKTSSSNWEHSNEGKSSKPTCRQEQQKRKC